MAAASGLACFVLGLDGRRICQLRWFDRNADAVGTAPWMIKVAGYTPLQAASGLFWISVAMLLDFWG